MFRVPKDSVLISDGGLATELEARGHDLSGDLWSARLLMDQPDEIIAVHSAFFESGSSIATAASYQASFDGFANHGISGAEAEQLLRRSVELAKTARARSGGTGYVAASVGPYGAALANGAEYTGRYGLSVSELAKWHRRRLEVLVSASPDVLALETIPDVDEAEALIGLVQELGLPTWLSYTISGDRTRAGQPLADAFTVAVGIPEIVAVGVNCCAPADVLSATKVAHAVTGKPVVVYPNSGEEWDGARRAWKGLPGHSGDLTASWVAEGARIVGGCCRIRPADIAALAATVG